MQLEELMTRSVVTVDFDDTLAAMQIAFERHRFHHLVVTEKGRVAGVISDRDLLGMISPFIGNPHMERRQDELTLRRRAHQIMSRKPVVGRPDMDVEHAARLLLHNGVSCLPVVNDRGCPIGIVTWRDLLRTLVPPDVVDEAA